MHKCPLCCPTASVPLCLMPSLAAVILGKGEETTDIWAHSPLPVATEGRWNVSKNQAQFKQEGGKE